jgi:hypothetical protein
MIEGVGKPLETPGDVPGTYLSGAVIPHVESVGGGSSEITVPGGGDVPVAQTSDAAPEVAAPEEPAASSFGEAMRKKHFHILGRTVVERPHSDPRVERELDLAIARDAANEARFKEVMPTLPNLNDRYAAEIAAGRSALVRDFGAHMANLPIAVVTKEAHTEALLAAGHGPQSNAGTYINGHVLVVQLHEDDQMLGGSGHITGNVLHEGGHAANPRTDVITTVNYDADARPGEHRGTVESHVVGGMTHINPRGTDIVNGAFLEEGTVDEYRVRKLTELGKAFFLPSRTDEVVFGDGQRGGFGGWKTHYDPKSDQLFLPWEYAHGAKVDEGRKKVLVATGSPALAAYGVRLLDERVPGLHAVMLHSGTNPDARAEAARMINSVEPGLYERLDRLRYDGYDFAYGLRLIEQALDVIDKPVHTTR